MTLQSSLLFVFGLGYSARQLALRLKAQGWSVQATARSESKAADMAVSGITPHLWQSGQAGLPVPKGAHWLISVPPDLEGCPVARAFGAGAGRAASVTYLSTTGVYGDLAGGWAFEWSPAAPQSERARARLKAEQQWLAASSGKARLVRLPGIYGPGRSAFDRLREGERTAIVKPGQVFSRIHVDDLASGLEALICSKGAEGVFHFCDDVPSPSEAVTLEAARLLGLPPPELTNWTKASLSPMARSFYLECKRVSNARAKSALGWRPLYPSYWEGLKAILAAENPAQTPG